MFLITTNANLSTAAILGFSFKDLNIAWVHIWIGIIWLYFHYRYWLFWQASPRKEYIDARNMIFKSLSKNLKISRIQQANEKWEMYPDWNGPSPLKDTPPESFVKTYLQSLRDGSYYTSYEKIAGNSRLKKYRNTLNFNGVEALAYVSSLDVFIIKFKTNIRFWLLRPEYLSTQLPFILGFITLISIVYWVWSRN